MQKSSIIIFRILQVSAFSVFIGRSYQHLFWDGPYRELFWDPFYSKWLVEHLTTMGWDEYVTNPAGDLWFKKFVLAQGVFYALCAIVTVFIKKLPSWCKWFLIVGALDLIFLALIYMKDKFYHFGQFFEYSLQFGAPLFFFYLSKIGELSKNLVKWMKVAVALTFACHGLYAMGYYPRPEIFMTMTQNILGLEKAGVSRFLSIVGIGDFVVCIGIFLPIIKWVKIVLWYAIVWGALTTFARIIGNIYWDFPLESLHQWVYEAVFRFPHFLVPLSLLIAMRQKAEAVASPAN